MQSCITRQAWDGPVLGENQRITPIEALALYTTGAAYATGEERIKGKLAPGFYADFVVLGANPLSTEPTQLSEIPVLATYVAGVCVCVCVCVARCEGSTASGKVNEKRLPRTVKRMRGTIIAN